MAADISEITESNQDYLPVILGMAEAQGRELAECLRILRKIERELDTWRPVMDRFKTPAAGYLAGRMARRAVPQDQNGQIPHA